MDSGIRFEIDYLQYLDAEGRVVARTETLGNKPDPQFLAAVKKTLAPTGKTKQK